jgi:hypothetical protein
MSEPNEPAACPQCGRPRVVPIFWGYSLLTEEQSHAVANAQAILGLSHRYFGDAAAGSDPDVRVHRFEQSRLPDRVCLDCAPLWRTLHRLALREYRVLAAMKAVFTWGELDRAVRILPLLERVERDHARAIWTILRELAPGALIEE